MVDETGQMHPNMIILRVLHNFSICFLLELFNSGILLHPYLFLLVQFSQKIFLPSLNRCVNILFHFIKFLELLMQSLFFHVPFRLHFLDQKLLLKRLTFQLILILLQMIYGYCTSCFAEHVYNAQGIQQYGNCNNCGKFNGVRYHNEAPFVAYCPKCFAEHKAHEFANNAYQCTKCGEPNALKFLKEEPFVAYCQECFSEYKTYMHVEKELKCPSCGKEKGLHFKKEEPYVAYCNQCFVERKTHQKINTFAKCTKCGSFNGLKFSKDAPTLAACKKCSTTYMSNNYKAAFCKCPNCNQFDGLKFKK